MISLTVFLGLFVLCSSEPLLVGGWNEQNGASESDFELAKWATNQLASLINFDGKLSLLNVKNVKTQVVAGVRYVLTIDVMAAPNGGKFSAKTCTVEIYTRIWEDFKQIVGTPTCVENQIYFQEPTPILD